MTPRLIRRIALTVAGGTSTGLLVSVAHMATNGGALGGWWLPIYVGLVTTTGTCLRMAATAACRIQIDEAFRAGAAYVGRQLVIVPTWYVCRRGLREYLLPLVTATALAVPFLAASYATADAGANDTSLHRGRCVLVVD